MIDPNLFKKELRHWALHTSICASPSFIMAIIFGFDSVTAILAMLCGIITMILGYTTISCTKLFTGNKDGILSKTKLYGLRARSVISLIELPGLALIEQGGFFLAFIDFYAGFFAVAIVDELSSAGFSDSNHTFAQTYAATIIEGILISVSIFMVILLVLALVAGIKRLRQPQPKQSA